jgi:hypothetical protein
MPGKGGTNRIQEIFMELVDPRLHFASELFVCLHDLQISERR